MGDPRAFAAWAIENVFPLGEPRGYELPRVIPSLALGAMRRIFPAVMRVFPAARAGLSGPDGVAIPDTRRLIAPSLTGLRFHDEIGLPRGRENAFPTFILANALTFRRVLQHSSVWLHPG